ncbi:Slp family lipoprotein [Candidatus Nitrospira bockiana]
MATAVLLNACAQSAHQTGRDLINDLLPADLRREIDSSVVFSDLLQSPDSYTGRTVMFSGIALKAKRVKDRTEIEVLQLPTGSGVVPSGDRTRSEGRFLAVQEGFLDPATVEAGTPVTVVGEVQGATTRALDESQYTYPVLEIKRLIDWKKTLPPDYSGLGPYPYYSGYPYYYGYRPYPYWYGPYGYYPYWGPFFPLLGSPGPAPSAPPPSSLPPQFRKRD